MTATPDDHLIGLAVWATLGILSGCAIAVTWAACRGIGRAVRA
jgi:hypothetical protein